MDREQEEGALSPNMIKGESMQKEREIFRRKLREFPNLFGINDYKKLTQKRQQTLLEKLSVEKEDGDQHCTEAEKTATSNLIAFLLFLRRDRDKAVEEIDNVLKSPNNDCNIVALASMAVMKWEMGDRQEGERFVERLEKLHEQKNFQEKVVDAKAEIAYCCSRMGMIYAPLAVDKFEEVVKARPRDYTWKLGLALVLRRFTHTNYVMYFRIASQLTSERSLRAFDLLLEIKNSDAPHTLRAEALVELGTLLQYARSPEFEDVNVKARQLGITAEQCYEEAVELAPTDPHVLTYSGKFFNNRKQLQRSRELLERAIAIRPTTTAHHYLGATFTKLARVEKYQSRQYGGGSARGRRYDNERGSESYSWRQNPPNRRNNSWGRSSRGGRQGNGRGQISPGGATRPGSLHIDQEHVQAAIYHFDQAIEISQGDNTPAIYDLGVLYICVGDDDQALNQFSKLINLTESRGSPMQLINSHEQVGFIYMRKKTRTRNETERQEYAAEGCRLLQEALQMQCQAVRSLPACEPDLPASRPSFYDLCCAAKGMKSTNHEPKEISRLYEMVKNYTDYLNVLTEISVFRPQDASDVEILEKRLKNYVTREQYDHALLFLSLLETTEEEQLVHQWSDPELPKRVRVMAARKKLLSLTDKPYASTDEMIKRSLLQAIQTTVSLSDDETESQFVDDGWSEDQEEKWWHVMILYNQDDDDMKIKGLAIKDILQNVCGLRVTCIANDDDNDLSDDSDVEPTIEKAIKSRYLLVLCGPEGHSGGCLVTLPQILKEVRSPAHCACKTVLALLMDNARRPENLNPDRCLQCPSPLFGHHVLYTPELIEAIDRLFCFLANVAIDTV